VKLKPDAEAMLLPRRKERIDEVVAQRTRTFTLVFDQIGDPHNLSAILRTCEGFGVQEVHVVVSKRDGYKPNPKITQGAEKWLDITFHADIQACAAHLKGRGFLFCVSDFGEASVPLHSLPLEKKVALVLGNEVSGVSEDAKALADQRFVIPMLGFAQSYNVSVTAAVCLALTREHRRKLGLVGDLDDADASALRRRFYELAVKQGGRIYSEE
jgi:tRNA (guanosine-2'-O-)-methyltransferase